jgi:thymidylate kinase
MAKRDPWRWVMLDGNRDPDQVQSDMRQAVLQRLNPRP